MSRPTPSEQDQGVAFGPGCQPSASDPSGSSQSGIPNAVAPSMLRSWLQAMTRQGEDRIWRGAERGLAELDGIEGQLAYLREYHDITQHLLGIMSLNASVELMGKVRPYSEKLDLLWINRMLDMGIPAESIGEHAMFYAYDHLVAQAIEARSAAAAKTDAVEDESAVPKGCAQS